jgi:ferrous iron transport protein A
MTTHSTINLPIPLPITLTKHTHPTEAVKNISHASTNTTYQIKEIRTTDQELKDFLLTLGCYRGEAITVVSFLSESYVIIIKDARYNIDQELAKAILIE